MSRARPSIRALRRIAAENVRSWRQFPNFEYAGIGRRQVGGRRTGDLTFVFYVSRKTDVPPEDTLPRVISPPDENGENEITTDVQEAAEKPIFLGARAGDQLLAGDGDAGTATVIGLARPGGSAFAFTCAHVVTNISTGQGIDAEVGWKDPATGTVFSVGGTVYATRLNAVQPNRFDAALVRLSSNLSANGHLRVRGEAGKVTGFDYFRTDQPGRFFYSTHRGIRFCRSPVPISGSVEITYVGPTGASEGSYPFLDVWRLESEGPGPDRGDSGALIYKSTSNGLVGYGVLFAGVPGKEVWAVSARPFIDFLKKKAP